jgi:hypothetical protein
MNIIFLLQGIVALGVVGISIWGLLKNFGKDYLNKVVNWFSMSAFGYAVIALFSGFWFFGVYEFDSFDYSLIYSLAILIQTVALYKSFKFFSSNKHLYHWLFFYLASVVAVLISIWYLPAIILTVSFFLTLGLLFSFVFRAEVFKKVTAIGIFYSCISLIFTFLIFFGVGSLFVFSFISSILFLLFVYFFLKDVGSFPLKHQSKIKFHGDHGVFLFLKYFVFMIVLINLVLITTVSVHEFGHIAASRFYGCEARTIVYEEGSYPYSEILCNDTSGNIFIALAGPALPLLVAILLFIIGGRYIRPIALLVLGFDLMASYRDLGGVGLSENLVVVTTVLGITCLLLGVALLARARMQEHRDHEFI